MTNLGLITSNTQPQPITYYANSVVVASNIQPYTFQTEDGFPINGYQYNAIEYTKDEFLALNLQKINTLEEELEAAKILLGVE